MTRQVQTFGAALRQLRADANLTQIDLAKAVAWSQSQISRAEKDLFVPDEATVARLDDVLGAKGQLTAAHATAKQPAADLVTPDRDPWAFSDLVRQIHRTDVGPDTIDQLNVITEQLCCEYVSRHPADLRADAQAQLEYVQRLHNGPTSLSEHRELLVIGGWLALLIGCVNYDLGLTRHAETARTAAFQLGREAGHGEIVAWSFEMSAWFALTQGRLRSVAEYATAGHNAAPHASVAVQLAAQAAKAHARMGNRSDVRHSLDQGFQLLAQHEHPTRPENHFVIDPTKWDFYAMDCYLVVGDNERAAEHAHEVINASERPDGSDRSPMRASEARLALATVNLRNGDLDAATQWAQKGFNSPRQSIKTLTMLAEELHTETRKRYGTDPAVKALDDVIISFYGSASNT